LKTAARELFWKCCGETPSNPRVGQKVRII